MREHPDSSEDQSVPVGQGLRQRWLQCLVPDKSPGAADEHNDLSEMSPWAWAAEHEITPQRQFEALAQVLRVPWVERLDRWRPVPQFLKNFDIAFARDHHILCVHREGAPITAVVCDFSGWQALDLVRRELGQRLHVVRTSAEVLNAEINRAYEGQNSETQLFIDSLEQDELRFDAEAVARANDLLDSSDRGPIVRMVNLILFEAVKAGASDIHIQPSPDRVVVRQRIDGILFDSFEIPKPMQEQVLTRIKVLARMNIAEKRLPQDGRATIHVGQRIIDLRIATLPTNHDERIVIRLLDKSARLYQLSELGMGATELARFRRMIRLDHGMILVTGPTGSGKSTTLYASLLEVNTVDLNVLTIEDPIEYQLEGVSQTQINEKKGMTFAAGLRSVLRQDPDIIMVGEIRDRDTAAMSVQASLTGHLVFSTLHTNDAASAVTRLLDLGIEPYLLASSLVAVLAQRLVRKICPHCVTDDTSTGPQHELSEMRLDATQGSPLRGAGCPACRGTGYQGRLGIFELLHVSESMRSLIQTRVNASEIRQKAVESGMKLLRTDGLEKALRGLTTLDEIERVSGAGIE